jgi:hypothetical protein
MILIRMYAVLFLIFIHHRLIYDDKAFVNIALLRIKSEKIIDKVIILMKLIVLKN